LYWTDRHTHTQTFHENPHFVSVKGKTKKAVAFGLFVYPNSKLVVLLQFAGAFAHQPKNSSACSCNQTVFQSTRLFNHMYFIIARAAYARRVQSLRRPDAAEKGNNVALLFFHGLFEGSPANAASERVTLIQ
jgi:hypothetical protein